MIREINNVLEATKASNPIYEVFLGICVAVGIYADKTESAYITSLAEYRYRETTARANDDEKMHLAEFVDAPHTPFHHRCAFSAGAVVSDIPPRPCANSDSLPVDISPTDTKALCEFRCVFPDFGAKCTVIVADDDDDHNDEGGVKLLPANKGISTVAADDEEEKEGVDDDNGSDDSSKGKE